MKPNSYIKLGFSFVVLTCLAIGPAGASAQDKIPDKHPLGFRSDFGLDVTIGGHVCAGGGGSGSQIECSGNNKGWDMGTGLAIGGQVRPLKYFSVGLELSYMGLRPADASDSDKLFKRFFDFAVGPVLKAHIPVRIKVVLMDITLGVKAAFVNGYLYAKPDGEVQSNLNENSKYYRHRLYGPELDGIIGLDLFIIPRFGFGIEFRPMATMYQSVCFDDGTDQLCRGVADDPVPANRFATPFKILFGLHLIYYL